MREQAEELPFTLKQAKKDMAKKLKNRMVELGLTKKAIDLTLFNELNIRDMIQMEKKKWCKTCFKGLKCKVHVYTRMGKKEDKEYDEERINMVFMPQLRKG